MFRMDHLLYSVQSLYTSGLSASITIMTEPNPDHTDSRAYLLVHKGVQESGFFYLDGDSFTIGKADTCDIVVKNPFVSRGHVRIIRDGLDFYIQDLNSKNGTLVNGSLLGQEPLKLRAGDRIDLVPEQVVFGFRDENSTVTFSPSNTNVASPVLTIFSRSREVWLRNQVIDPPLSKKEFDILNLLSQNQGQICSKDEIASAGWPERTAGDVKDQDVEQYIRRLRVKLEDNPSSPSLIVTVHGSGYKLAEY